MRKAVLLGALASLAAISFGCAFTDYPNVSNGANGLSVTNKSHGMISCVTDDRGLNSQQTFEREMRQMLLNVKDAAGNTPCPIVGGVFLPPVTTDTPDFQTAREWGRFLSSWLLFTGAGVTLTGNPCTDGQWEMAGLKDLDDGTVRIVTTFQPVPTTPFPHFSCAFGFYSPAWGPPGNGGKTGSTEGVVYAEGYPIDGPVADLPNYHMETVALDNRPGTEFCANIAAETPWRAACGYSTLWAGTGRFSEQRLNFTPITRHGGLAEFFAGQPMDISLFGGTATVHGELLDNGRVRVFVDSMRNDLATYRAGEQPIFIEVSTGGRLMPQVTITSQDELRAVYQFALDAGLADRKFDLPKFVPEVGLSLPPVSFVISGEFIQAQLDNISGGEGDGGFGG